MLEAKPIDYQQLQSGLKGLHEMQNIRSRYFSSGDSASKYLPLGRKDDDYLGRMQRGSSLSSNPTTRSSLSGLSSLLDDRLEIGGNYGAMLGNSGMEVSRSYGRNSNYQLQPQLNYRQ